MSASRFGRIQKATALVPLALLSAAWTVSVTGVIPSSTGPAGAAASPPASLPDGTELPEGAIDDPASVTDTLLGEDAANGADVVRTASASGIPAAALAAYQRAATVINSADEGCNLDWQLIAAIGLVESDHGRVNGNVLNDDGLATPGIYGLPLNGDGVARIIDTDGGQFDGDTRFDRAVGPMQFIPSTWSMVGVDADSDGTRDPQDIDDAALGTAVYLCSGDADLSTDQGRREAVYRYNHSEEYVDTVLGVYEAYLSGDYTEAPNGTVPSNDGVLETDKKETDRPGSRGGNDDRSPKGGDDSGDRNGSDPGPSGDQDGNGDSGGDSGSQTKDPPVQAPEQEKPTEKKTDRPPARLTQSSTKIREGGEKIGSGVAAAVATPGEILEACRTEIEKRFGTSDDDAVEECVKAVGDVTVRNLDTTVTNTVAGLTDVLEGLLDLGGGLVGTLTGQG